MGKFNIFIVLLLTILVLFSCKKNEEESSFPKVSIHSPQAGATFTVGDSILVKASVSHDKPVKSVVVSLVDNNNVPQVTPQGMTPEQSVFEITETLVIDNNSISSGTYYVMVKASDEANTTRTFQPVEVNGTEPSLTRILVIARFNSLESLVYEINAEFQVTQLFSISHTYQGSALSSKYQQLYYIKPDPSKLMTYDLAETMLDWEYTSQSPYPVFEDVYYAEDLVYLASRNGNLIGLNSLGKVQFGTVTHADRIPFKIFKHKELIITDQGTRSNLYRYFTLFYAATGAFANQHQTDMEVVGFFSRNEQEIIAFGHKSGQAAVLVYDVLANNSQAPSGVPPGTIWDAVQISGEEVLLATDTGVYKYNISTYQYSLAFDFDDVSVMDYDAINNYLCFARGNQVMIYKYPGSGFLHQITMDYPVLNLHLVYN